jgi:hypothetical protein
MKAKIVDELGIIQSTKGTMYLHRIIEDSFGRKREVAKLLSAIPKPRAELCEQCGESINPARSTMRFCSARCRMRAHRSK